MTAATIRPLVFASLLVVCHPALADDGGWRRVNDERGIVVEVRDVAGSLRELRATVHADARPEAILAVLWKHEEYPQFLPSVKRVAVLEDRANERLVYEELSLPVVKDRDLVLRARRAVEPATGVVDVWGTAVPGAGPPASRRFVRVRVSDGHWHLVPARGGTDVTYTNRTDVAGFLPDWIVNRIQRQTVPDLVHAVLDRAARGNDGASTAAPGSR